MGCYNSTVVNANADKVWEKLNDFHDLSWSENVVESVEKKGDKAGGQPGAKRILNGAFHETLLSMDADSRQLTYSIDDGPDAVSKDNVSGYVGTVTVLPVTDTDSAFVEWKSEWESTREGGVADFCNPIYHALLQDLKAHFKG
ncbi:MAG: SRPBCC family protein [Balneolaceae bacterium]